MRKLTVKDAMSEKPIKATPDMTVAEAARVMTRKNIRSMPVCVGAKLVGLVTSEDVMRRVVAQNRSAENIKLKDIMTKTPVTVEPDLELVDAMKLMVEKNIHRLLVTEDSRLVGILTDGDVLRVAPDLIEVLYAEIEELKKDVEVAEAADVCESCGNYSPDLKIVNGELLCEGCRESSTYI